MTHTVQFIEDKQYVKVILADTMTKVEHEKNREEVIRVLAEKGWKRLLVDVVQLHAKMSVFEDFEFTQDHQATLFKNIRMAIIHRADETERYTFIENVAVNRGLQIRVFTDPEEGIGWLTST